MTHTANIPSSDRLQYLMSRVQDGYIPIDNLFPEKRLYKVLGVFNDDAKTMFMLIGEFKDTYALFEASQFNDWSFHSSHSSLDGALNEIRDFRLKRIS
jgi:hypothetical protein